MGSEVAVQEGAVPALQHDPATTIDARDIAFPKLKIGQDMHDQVQNGLVKRGEIFTVTSKEDTDPVVLDAAGPGLDGKPSQQTGDVKLFVLGIRKGWSLSVDGNLFTWAFDDPDVPEKAWITYTYLLAVPVASEILPVTFLLTKTGRPAAQQINQALALNAGSGPTWNIAFTLTNREAKNEKGRFFVAKVAPYEGTEAELATAKRLYEQFGPGSAGAERAKRATSEPQI